MAARVRAGGRGSGSGGGGGGGGGAPGAGAAPVAARHGSLTPSGSWFSIAGSVMPHRPPGSAPAS
jgi:hypothetical protein